MGEISEKHTTSQLVIKTLLNEKIKMKLFRVYTSYV